VRLLGGYFVFDSLDAALLVSLLPALNHSRGAKRLEVLVRLVNETGERKPGARNGAHPPGRGVAGRSVTVYHRGCFEVWPMRGSPLPFAKCTVSPLGRGPSRSLPRSFLDWFTRTVGIPPMEYLLFWRIAVAKDLLRRRDLALEEVAESVGHGSASTFSTAFRYVGQPPGRYARAS
jgi:hypothetical protein